MKWKRILAAGLAAGAVLTAGGAQAAEPETVSVDLWPRQVFVEGARVAFLNEPMWTELFLENRENLLRELRELQGHLSDYIQALEDGNWDTLEGLLREGRTLKVLSDNREV